MKRAVIASTQPWKWLPQLDDYSIMIVDPDSSSSRYQYLLSNSDFSLLLTDAGHQERNGGDYHNERLLLYTSGTTGDSKFYSFSQQQLDRICDVMINAYRITANDRYYGYMPLWHAHGQTWYWATLRAGCDRAFGNISDMRKIETFQPTFLSGIPKLLKVSQRLDLKCLRFLRSASAAMPRQIYEQLTQRFQVPVIEAFGITEAISHCFTNPLDGPQKMGTVGLADGIQARIDLDQHLWIKSASAYTNDWFDTGDLAAVDADGYYTILGRHIDQINVNGVKINPLSIEQQIYDGFENITECAVFGRDRLKCVYIGNIDADQIATFITALGSACRPILCQKLDEIPKNGSGKISRTMLEKLIV